MRAQGDHSASTPRERPQRKLALPAPGLRFQPPGPGDKDHLWFKPRVGVSLRPPELTETDQTMTGKYGGLGDSRRDLRVRGPSLWPSWVALTGQCRLCCLGSVVGNKVDGPPTLRPLLLQAPDNEGHRTHPIVVTTCCPGSHCRSKGDPTQREGGTQECQLHTQDGKASDSHSYLRTLGMRGQMA